MKNISFISEIATAGIIIGILLLFIRPTKLLMPDSLSLMVTLLLILAFIIYVSLLWKEKSTDEREELHRLNAGRISFITGATVLIIGVVVQSLKHNVDPWLVFTLSAMVLAKIASRIYSRIRH
jgi:hypothetical protein